MDHATLPARQDGTTEFEAHEMRVRREYCEKFRVSVAVRYWRGSRRVEAKEMRIFMSHGYSARVQSEHTFPGTSSLPYDTARMAD